MRPHDIKQTVQDNIAQWKAEQRPITPEDQRCIERLQNYELALLKTEVELLRLANGALNRRIDALERNAPNWQINVPPMPYRTIGGRGRVLHFEPAPDPIDGPRDYGMGSEDESC